MNHIKAYDIAGYSYDADMYCDGVCIILALGETPKDGTVEEQLDRIAAARGIDRTVSHCSTVFPHVAFFSDDIDTDHCAGCHGPLLDHDCDEHAAGRDM